jgi:hypothetical protein
MKMETVIRLLEVFGTCPKCNRIIFIDELKIDDNYFELKCKCGWVLKVKEE